MLLEIDAGNTRLKWRLSEFGPAGPGAVLGRGSIGESAPQLVLERLFGELRQLGATTLTRVLVSSVRDAGFSQYCGTVLHQCFGARVEFAAAAAQWRGLRNGYRQPMRLGVDRWLALLAAYAETGDACCVVDCGTTITLDIVAPGGAHEGGFIVPGLRLLQDSLAARSAALAGVPAEPACEPGRSTAEAIAHGAFTMVLGFLRDQKRQCQARHGVLPWYLTGGDAPTVGAVLDWESRHRPELVLDGLRLALL